MAVAAPEACGPEPRDGAPGRALCIGLATAILMWPAVVNGGVFFATDSIAYIRGPDQALARLLGPGGATAWSARPMGLGYTPGQGEAGPAPAGRSQPMEGRSIYYGLLANLGARTGGFWLTVMVQALAAALSLDLLRLGLGFTRRRTLVAMTLTAALLTPMAFFADCVMPDAWTPVAILCMAALVAGAERLSLADRIGALALMSYAASVHTTHPLLLAVMALGAAGLLLLRVPLRLRAGRLGLAVAMALVALTAGLAAGAAFDTAVTHVYGQAPLRPPFLTARLVGDGRPGEPWLRAHCPAAAFHACNYVSRLPMATDAFLWSGDPVKSVFWTATPQERTALGKEQFAFARAVLADDPAGVARQFLLDGAGQFADMSMLEFNHKDSVRVSMQDWMVGQDAAVWRSSLAYRKRWPTGVMEAIQLLAFFAAAAGLVVAAVSKARPADPAIGDLRGRLLAAGAVITVAVLANAFLCGGLSDIFGRYQARVSGCFILVGLIALWAAAWPPRWRRLATRPGPAP